MVVERTGPKHNWYFSDDERTAMMQRLDIPLHATAWLGLYTGRWFPFTAGVILGTPSEDSATGVTYTFTVGRLALQLITVRQIDERAVLVRIRPGPWHATLFRVSPFEGRVAPFNGRVEWPQPLLRIGDSGSMTLQRLLTRFNSKNVPLPFPI